MIPQIRLRKQNECSKEANKSKSLQVYDYKEVSSNSSESRHAVVCGDMCVQDQALQAVSFKFMVVLVTSARANW